MPHVLLVCEYPTLHGGERSLLAVLPRLRERGYRFTALAPDEGPLANALRANDVAVEPFLTHDNASVRIEQAALRERLAVAMRRLRPDLMHANSLSMGRLLGPVAASLSMPSIGHVRDMVGLSRQAVADVNQNSRLLAVSQATRAFHVSQGMAAERIFVVYNGIDTERFFPREPTGYLHRELRLPRSAMLVGSIGQLVVRKGHDVLLRAAADVVRRVAGVHFLMVGERFSRKTEAEEYEAALRRTAAAPPLAGRVHFLPVRDDIERLLPELTVLAHPARQEPLGRVLLEAAASGVAIVATEVGGTCEIFPAEAGAARHVPPDDPTAFGEALVELLSDEASRRELTAAALNRIRQAFRVDQAAEALAGHYEAALAAERVD